MSSFKDNLARSQTALAYTQSIIDTIRDPLLILDNKLRVMTASRAFCEVFHVTREETEDHPVYSLGNGQWDTPRLRQALEVILPEQSSFEDFEVDHTFPGIGKRTMVLNARKIWRSENHVELILLAFEDITQRKAAEEKLLKLTDELKHSNADLENFVRIAGHDLRAPLNSIIQYAQLLERRVKDQLGDDERLFLQRIMDGGQRMSKLLSDLLDYATLAQTSEEHLVAVAVKPVCEEVLVNLDAAIQKSRAQISFEIGDDVRVRVERTLLLVLLQNLAGNAINYARTSVAPVIRVSAFSQGDEWKLAVEDNGIGIEESYRQQIFEPFKRLHGSNRPGSGIGLSICQRIVERAKGKIWVDSEPEKGSIFYFQLPKA